MSGDQGLYVGQEVVEMDADLVRFRNRVEEQCCENSLSAPGGSVQVDAGFPDPAISSIARR